MECREVNFNPAIVMLCNSNPNAMTASFREAKPDECHHDVPI
jgi:hypothetical protein